MGWSLDTIAAQASGDAPVGLSLDAIAVVLGPMTGLSVDALSTAQTAGYFAGSVGIDTYASLAAAVEYRHITGTIYINGGIEIPGVAFPNLRTVRAFVGSINSVVTSYSFPELVSVGPSGGFSVTNNDNVLSVSVPKLESVGGDFSLQGNTGLTLQALPELSTVIGDFAFLNNGATTLSASVLATITGNMSVSQNSSLLTLNLSSLISVGIGNVGSITITDNPGLTDAAMNAIYADDTPGPAGTLWTDYGWRGTSTISGNG